MRDIRDIFAVGEEPEWFKRPGGSELTEKILRCDMFVGALEGLKVAIAHEEDPGYPHYLANVVRPFLEREKAQAEEEVERYRRKHFELA
jgi:hypothetical protein